jgi:O-antigen/teichoic acid export membrane protein
MLPAERPPPVLALDRGRVGRAVMTWMSGAIYTGITLSVGLIATPRIIAFLGESRFGAFRAVTDWMGYLLVADLGLGTAFGVLLVRAHAVGGNRPASVVRDALRVLSQVTLVSIPVGLLLAWFMPYLIRDGLGLAQELRMGAVVVVAGLLLGPLLVFRSDLEASQRGYLVNVALLAQSLVVTALSVLLAWRGLGLVGQSIAGLAGLAVFVAMLCWWSPSAAAFLTRSVSVSAMRGEGLWSLSWPLAVAGAGNRLNLMTDTIVVGKMLGVTQVAMLFLTQRIILLCAGQVNGLANASWAALAELRQSGQAALFEARLAELARLIVGVGLVLVGTVAAFDWYFVQLWVGPRLYGGDLVCVATLASVVTFGFLLPFAWAIDMAGDTRHRLLVSTIGSILNLALSIVFVKRFGLAGVAMGTFCAYMLTDAWYCPLLVCRRYNVRPRLILEAAGRGLLVGLPWFACVWILTRVYPPPLGWVGLLVESALVGSAALLYCWVAILNPNDRLEWTRRLRVACA